LVVLSFFGASVAYFLSFFGKQVLSIGPSSSSTPFDPILEESVKDLELKSEMLHSCLPWLRLRLAETASS